MAGDSQRSAKESNQLRIVMVGGLKIIQVKSGYEKEFERLFAELHEAMRTQEPGCLLYSLLKSRKKAGAYIVHEQYRDQAALDAHGKTRHGSVYFPRIRAVLESVSVEYFDGVVCGADQPVRQETAAEKNRVLVAADPTRNLLRLSYAGDIGPNEAEHFERAVEDALATMSGGFCLLADFTELRSMDLLCAPYIERTMERIGRCGVARIVRVIPDPSKDIGFNIMSLFHYPHGLQIVTCKGQSEAERALA
jgi:quinol monooxygenase YgiN